MRQIDEKAAADVGARRDVSAREPFHERWVAEDGDPLDSVATYIKHGDAERLPAQVHRNRGLAVRDRAVHTPVAGAAVSNAIT